MSRRSLRLIFLIAVTTSLSLYGLVGMQSASAATITVNTLADEFTDPGPQTGCSLREAIQAANTDDSFGGCPEGTGADTIVLSLTGTYTLDRVGGDDDNTNGDLDIFDDGDFASNDLTIQGLGATTTTIEQTVVDERVIEIHSFAGEFVVTISGVTVTGGDEDAEGGGIRNSDQSLRLFGVEVTANHSDNDGGGIYNDSGVLEMHESAITLNTTDGSGGGLFNDDIATLTNVTISGNEADDDGGGIVSDGEQIHLQNVTVTANTADDDLGGSGGGGGIDQDDGTVTLRNTIVAGNTDASPAPDPVDPDCDDTVLSQGHNLIGNSAGCGFAAAAGDLVGTAAAPINPMLGPLALNGGTTRNHALLAGSPAINAGDPVGAPPIDQRGLPRDAQPDIGAFEVQAAAAAPAAVTCKGKTATLVGTAGNDTLTGTAARDIVAALGGKDTIKTKGGKDLVCAGKGRDKAGGGAGKDRLLGQGGKDQLKGAGGNDRLNGGKGRDKCNGGPGTDKGNCEVETNIP